LGDTVEALLQAGAFGARIVEIPVPMEQRAAGDATTSVHAAGQFGRVLVTIIAGKPSRPA
jgi:hypothetical protein